MFAKFKILVVCSRNQWRSPTAEQIYRHSDKVEVRSAGTNSSAKHQISQKDVDWADVILCMEPKHKTIIQQRFSNQDLPPIQVLNIEDNYAYMDPELIELLTTEIEGLVLTRYKV